MKRVSLAYVGAALLLAGAFGGFPAAGQAQIDDHLKCYKIKDPLKLKGIVDIDTQQFGLEAGCKISKALLFCVPAKKTVREAWDASTKPPTPINILPITGPPAPGDRVCYKVRCPSPFPPEQEISDQFGTRIVENLKPFLLCTPAVKGPPTDPSCGETYPQCNGSCPIAGDVCVNVPGQNECECLSTVSCGVTYPQCNGACPSATPDCVPVKDGSGASLCRCK